MAALPSITPLPAPEPQRQCKLQIHHRSQQGLAQQGLGTEGPLENNQVIVLLEGLPPDRVAHHVVATQTVRVVAAEELQLCEQSLGVNPSRGVVAVERIRRPLGPVVVVTGEGQHPDPVQLERGLQRSRHACFARG